MRSTPRIVANIQTGKRTRWIWRRLLLPGVVLSFACSETRGGNRESESAAGADAGNPEDSDAGSGGTLPSGLLPPLPSVPVGGSGGLSGAPVSPEPEPQTQPAEPDTPASGGGPSVEPLPSNIALPLRYLRAEPDTRLVIELDAVPGLEPRAASEAVILRRFRPLLDKPDGIEIVHDDEIPPSDEDTVWTDEALAELAQEMFDDDSAPGTVSMHVMFLDGTYASESGSTLGVAWGSRFVAMFKNVIEGSCGGLALLPGLEDEACVVSESGVWSHEIGHVLGLVNNGIEMQTPYEDKEHPHHDASEGCLMYWAYDGPSFVDTAIARLASGEAEIEFCENNLNDLAAAREQ
jgi:hypothetical protein